MHPDVPAEYTYCQERDTFNGLQCCTGADGYVSELNVCSEGKNLRPRNACIPFVLLSGRGASRSVRHLSYACMLIAFRRAHYHMSGLVSAFSVCMLRWGSRFQRDPTDGLLCLLHWCPMSLGLVTNASRSWSGPGVPRRSGEANPRAAVGFPVNRSGSHDACADFLRL